MGISCKLNRGSEFVGNQNPAVEFPPTLLLLPLDAYGILRWTTELHLPCIYPCHRLRFTLLEIGPASSCEWWWILLLQRGSFLRFNLFPGCSEVWTRKLEKCHFASQLRCHFGFRGNAWVALAGTPRQDFQFTSKLYCVSHDSVLNFGPSNRRHILCFYFMFP